MVATNDIIGEVRTTVPERSVLKHPFYPAWQPGALTHEHLRGYAGPYYPHLRALRQSVSDAYAICPGQSARQELGSFLDGVHRAYVAA